MNLETLEKRLDRIESRLAIESLIWTYAQAYDRVDEALLESIWHVDATLDLPAFGHGTGREGILAMARESWRKMPHMHHWMANPLIELDGESATAVSQADCLFHDIEQGPVQAAGLYHDRFERRDGEWRFTARRFELMFLVPLQNWKPTAGSQAFARS